MGIGPTSLCVVRYVPNPRIPSNFAAVKLVAGILVASKND